MIQNPPVRPIQPPNPAPVQDSPDILEWTVLAAVFALGAFLRLWRIDQNGTGNPYYAAAVRSMLQSWHNFFFVSFDPAGFVTVDKPPVALWIQTAFAKLFGYSGFTLILPQVLEGLASLGLVWHLVRRRFGPWAALFSSLVLALSPVSVAVDRYNNTDACLVLVILLAAWALIKAAETGDRKFLFLSLILAGVGFNTKMLAAFVVLPAIYLVYLFGTHLPWLKRVWNLTVGTLILVAVSLSWPLVVDLTPPEQRPFVGSTQDNSMISLSLGWNGFQRLLSRGRGGRFGRPGDANRPGGGDWSGAGNRMEGRDRPQDSRPPRTREDARTVPSSPSAALDEADSQVPGRGRRGFMNTGEPGPLRLADKNLAGQVAWFLPWVLLGFWAEFRRTRPTLPLSPKHQALALWMGWLLLYAVVFSFMRGAMHAYYLVLMVPPLAALAGIGAKALWDQLAGGSWSLPVMALLATAAWQAFIVAQYPDWKAELLDILLPGIAMALFGLSWVPSLKRWVPRAERKYFMGLGLFFLFVCPAFWALTPVLGSGQTVEASPDLLSGGRRGGIFMGFGGGVGMSNAKLLGFLRAHRRDGQYLVVAQNSQAVAPIIIATGEPAVALGGFMGGDPILTVHQFSQDVADGKIRFILLPDAQERPDQAGGRGNGAFRPGAAGFGGGFGRKGGQQAEIAQWVRDNGKIVDPALWKPAQPQAGTAAPAQGFPGGFGGRRGGMANLRLYDLSPRS